MQLWWLSPSCLRVWFPVAAALRFVYVACLSLLVGLAAGCTWMSQERASQFLGREVVKRAEVLARLQAAVWTNAASCTNNQYPAAYAIDFSLGAELNEPFYDATSVDICILGFLSVPCASSPVTDQATVTALYTGVLRACGPLPRGL